MAAPSTPAPPARTRIIGAALAIGATTAAYGLSFGALSTASGLSLAQTAALSLLMFTGASQYAFVGAIAAGANPFAGALTAALLGARNAFYSLRLSPLLGLAGWRRAGAAHLVIDETAAMAVAQEAEADGRFAFWSTGWSVFVLWNLATIAGALGARALPDPKVIGLDAAAPAAFLALMTPRILDARQLRVAAIAAVAALAAVPLTPNGVPVLIAATVAMGAAAAPLARRGSM
jgi:predicted branched-subunit amino acid permease